MRRSRRIAQGLRQAGIALDAALDGAAMICRYSRQL
jgi:hypothetical protein